MPNRIGGPGESFHLSGPSGSGGSTFTTGSVLFVGTGGHTTEDNANLYWDNANDDLHVGPRGSDANTLNVYGNMGARGNVISLYGALQVQKAQSTETALFFRADGDNSDHFAITAAGAITWGPGSGAADITLQRLSSANLGLLGQLGVGTLVPTAQFHANLDGGDVDQFRGQIASSTAANSVVMTALRSRGTLAVPTVVSTGDRILQWQGFGHNGTTFSAAGAIFFEVDQPIAGGFIPGRLVFTVTSTSAGNVEAMRINSSAHVGIGTSAPSGPLQVNHGSTAIMAVTTANQVGIGTTAPTASLEIQGGGGGSSAALLLVPGATGSTSIRGVVIRRSTATQADALVVETTTPGAIAGVSGIGTFRASDGSSNANAGFGYQQETGLGMRRNRAGFLSLGTSAAGSHAVITAGSSGTTMKLGFFSTATVSRPSSYTPDGTSGRVLPTTVTPAAVYSSNVGAQVNQLQGVLRTLIKDLAAYGLEST